MKEGLALRPLRTTGASLSTARPPQAPTDGCDPRRRMRGCDVEEAAQRAVFADRAGQAQLHAQLGGRPAVIQLMIQQVQRAPGQAMADALDPSVAKLPVLAAVGPEGGANPAPIFGLVPVRLEAGQSLGGEIGEIDRQLDRRRRDRNLGAGAEQNDREQQAGSHRIQGRAEPQRGGALG